MANIKERIKRISEYFQEMQITTVGDNQVIYVVVQFPDRWIIDDDIEEKFNVTINEGTQIGEYYFCADIEVGEAAVFDAIEYNIEKMKEAIERAQLLNTKMRELKALFEDDRISIETLRTLSFKMGPVEESKPEEIIFQKKRKGKEAVTEIAPSRQESTDFIPPMDETDNNEVEEAANIISIAEAADCDKFIE